MTQCNVHLLIAFSVLGARSMQWENTGTNSEANISGSQNTLRAYNYTAA